MDTPGRTVGGRYRLIEPLGRGGMGTVWRAEDAVLGRQVAVKEVAFPHGLSDEDRENLRERTRREARAAARLDHPSAVTVYDVVEEDGQPWLVLELVEARTLAELVRSDGPLTVRETAHVGLALLGALEAAHAQGIVHRDVKPSNVLISRTGSTGLGRVVLTDFGIATSAGDASITSTGLLLGSPSYISPERARGLPPGPAADLWSLGATLFTAVEGRPPYDKGEPLPTLTAVVTGDQEPYVAAGPLVPVLDGLLAPDPDRRLSSSQARALLQEVLSTADLGALPVPQPEPQAEVRSERTTALPVGPGAGLPAPEPVAPRTVVAA
ncbi:MAG: serine/threonine protein kinase, partial [Frankiales bacterium]|nr:serine/threonine protein kinase [Frankiales bacterium]